jgi:murein DD-endopeptidase MepM/ murein hydrolase activator NlpD
LTVVLLLGLGAYWGIDLIGMPTQEEVALRDENDALREQLQTVEERMAGVSEELDDIAETDQELYRALLQAEPIPDDVRKVGVGGADPYESFDRFSENTSTLLRRTAEQMDQLERQVSLQNTSFRELSELAVMQEERMEELPAILPTDGPIVSSYGMRYHPILRVRKMHGGVDFLVSTGTPVMATADGVVSKAGYNSSYGKHIIIEHEASGHKTLYAHLSEIPRTTRKGKRVKRGEQIGLSGNTGRSTGPHLHYEVRDKDGRVLNPVHFFTPSMTPQQYLTMLEETQRETTSLDY